MEKRINNKWYLEITLSCLILIFSVLITSCKEQNKKVITPQDSINKSNIDLIDSSKKEKTSATQDHKESFLNLNIDEPIMQVLRRIFQDKSGNLWFVGDDVYRYDGDSFVNVSDHKVFNKTTIRQIAEDQEGNIWFGTSDGIIKYSPKNQLNIDNRSFVKFTEKDGLINNDVWSMIIDNEGTIWIGTLEGVSKFNSGKFTHFPIPETEPDHLRGITSSKIVHCILEDRKGNIWLGTNGGAFVYDGKSLSTISENEGLCNNTVNDLLEDKNGNIWFATHHKGVCYWNGTSFSPIVTKGEGTEAWSLYEDRSGNIWFPIEHEGVYRYKKGSIANFEKNDGLMLNAIHAIFEDKKGLFWFGGFGGLYRYDEKNFTHIPKSGLWIK